MSIAIFICGPAGAGKTTLAKYLVPLLCQRHTMPFCLLDKDTLTAPLSSELMFTLTGNRLDRDSPVYKGRVRDLDYTCVLETAKENMALGVNAVLPGPWTRELQSGALFRPTSLGLSSEDKTLVVWLELSEDKRKERIVHRGNPLDEFKLQNWDAYARRQALPSSLLPKDVLVLDALLSLDQAAERISEALGNLPAQ